MLEKIFAFVSRSHVMSLRNELNAIKKGVDSIDGYFQKIKQARDRLATVSVLWMMRSFSISFLKVFPLNMILLVQQLGLEVMYYQLRS